MQQDIVKCAGRARVPAQLRALVMLYSLASLLHFAHNAEYIAFHPNMPAWLTREQVYLVWLAITSVGAAGLLFASAGFAVIEACLLGVYGALGLDGLGHYALALCAQHSLFMNFTIWFEVATGFVLSVAAFGWALRQLKARARAALP